MTSDSPEWGERPGSLLSGLVARRHEPPAGWPPQVFAQITDAIAAALVAAVRRAEVRGQKASAQ